MTRSTICPECKRKRRHDQQHAYDLSHRNKGTGIRQCPACGHFLSASVPLDQDLCNECMDKPELR